jgi:protein arginine kinase
MKTSELSPLALTVPWSGPGPESDVVIASRVRLSRNLADREYSGMVSATASDLATESIVQAVREQLTPEPFGVDAYDLNPRTLDQVELGMLAERGVLDHPLPARLFLTADERLSISVCNVDHLRIAVVAPGLDANEALRRAREVDCALEERLNYAVALDWGYLSTEIMNLGTAMRASVLTHLPALTAYKRVQEISASLNDSGFELLVSSGPLKSRRPPSLALLRNTRTLGSNEDALCGKLEDYAVKLVHYERVAREELCSAKGRQVADQAHRALGLLRFARSLSTKEAYSLVSELRLGVVAGLVDDVTTEAVTALFLIIQDNHVRAGHRGADRGAECDDANAARAELVRKSLGTA